MRDFVYMPISSTVLVDYFYIYNVISEIQVLNIATKKYG